jgi:hypothetical protein
MKKLILMSLLLSTTAFANKVELQPCEEVGATIENLLPGASNQRSFYNERVSLYRYDTIEPAAGSEGIAIAFQAPENAEGGIITRKCLAVTFINSVDLKNATSSYDAKTGVTIRVPIKNYDPETGGSTNGKVEINVRQVNTGKINEGFALKVSRK